MAILRTKDIKIQAEEGIKNIKNKFAEVKIKNKKTNRLDEGIANTQEKKGSVLNAKNKLSKAGNEIKNKFANIRVNKKQAGLKAQESKIVDNKGYTSDTSENLRQVFGVSTGASKLSASESPAMWEESQAYVQSEYVGQGKHLDVKSSPSLKRRFNNAKEKVSIAASRLNKFSGSLENLASESFIEAKEKLSNAKRQLSSSLDSLESKMGDFKEKIVDKLSKEESVQDVRFWEQSAAYKDGRYVGAGANNVSGEGTDKVGHRETFTRKPEAKTTGLGAFSRMSKVLSDVDLQSVKEWFKSRISRSDSSIDKAGKEEQRSKPASSAGQPEMSPGAEDTMSHAQRLNDQRASSKIASMTR